MTPPEHCPPVDDDIYRGRFEHCFDAHYGRIFAFVLRRVRGQDGAEDVVAETFAIAWRRRDRIPDPALPWLYGIAANVIANQRRASARRQNLDRRLVGEAGIAAPRTDPAELFGDRDELAGAFARLDEAERALRLRSSPGPFAPDDRLRFRSGAHGFAAHWRVLCLTRRSCTDFQCGMVHRCIGSPSLDGISGRWRVNNSEINCVRMSTG